MSTENSVFIPPAAERMLDYLSEQNGISKAALLEILIGQAYKAKWTVLKPISASLATESELIDFPLLKRMLNENAYSSLTAYLEERGVYTWLGLGRQGVKMLGSLEGIGDYTIKGIRSLLKEQNVILGR